MWSKAAVKSAEEVSIASAAVTGLRDAYRRDQRLFERAITVLDSMDHELVPVHLMAVDAVRRQADATCLLRVGYAAAAGIQQMRSSERCSLQRKP